MGRDRVTGLARLFYTGGRLPLLNLPYPAGMTDVAGCDCGGLDYHATACGLWDDPDRGQAAIDAARARMNGYLDDLNRSVRELRCELATRQYLQADAGSPSGLCPLCPRLQIIGTEDGGTADG